MHPHAHLFFYSGKSQTEKAKIKIQKPMGSTQKAKFLRGKKSQQTAYNRRIKIGKKHPLSIHMD